tara:strand:- start:425 stop:916 length:492 start_codon:yes stop_codon:yes gene_type:complete
MFRGEFGKCSQCSNQTLIVINKPYLCKKCNDARKKMKKLSKTLIVDPTPKKAIKRSSIKYKKKEPTGEGEMFRVIWDERDHICTGCNKHLGDEAIVHYFSHILTKGQYPRLRLEKDNIMIECKECHYTQDFGTIDQKSKLLNWNEKLKYIKKYSMAFYLKLTK